MWPDLPPIVVKRRQHRDENGRESDNDSLPDLEPVKPEELTPDEVARYIINTAPLRASESDGESSCSDEEDLGLHLPGVSTNTVLADWFEKLAIESARRE